MADLDLTRPHIVTAPHRIPYAPAMWVAFCTCGGEFQGATAEEVRIARRPHWDAEQRRLSKTKERA